MTRCLHLIKSSDSGFYFASVEAQCDEYATDGWRAPARATPSFSLFLPRAVMSVPRVSLVGGTSSRHSDETIIEVKVRSMQGKDEATIADEMGINVTSVRRFLGRVKVIHVA